MSEAGLEVVDVESLRLHYARTLDFWSANLEARLKEAARLVPEETLRIWRLYLAGCAYGFKRGWINLHQILAIRPTRMAPTSCPGRGATCTPERRRPAPLRSRSRNRSLRIVLRGGAV